MDNIYNCHNNFTKLTKIGLKENDTKGITNRYNAKELRESLLKQLDNGDFEPKRLKREKVKEILLSFRRSLQKVGSECIKSSMTTFDYV